MARKSDKPKGENKRPKTRRRINPGTSMPGEKTISDDELRSQQQAEVVEDTDLEWMRSGGKKTGKEQE